MPELDDVGGHLELFRKAVQAALGDLHQAVLHLLDEAVFAAVDPQTLRALVAVCHLQEGGLALRGLLLLPVLKGLGQLAQPVEVGLASEQLGFLEVVGQHQLAQAQEVQHVPEDGPVAIDEGVAHGVHVHHGLLPHDYLFQQGAGMLGQGLALRGIQVAPHVDGDGAGGRFFEALAGLQQVRIDLSQFTLHPSEIPFHAVPHTQPGGVCGERARERAGGQIGAQLSGAGMERGSSVRCQRCLSLSQPRNTHIYACAQALAVGGGVLRVGSTASAVWAREERAFCSLPSALKAAFNHLSTSAPLWLSNYRRCPLMKGLLGWVAARELTERAESQGSHIMNSLKWERDVNALASIVLSRCFGKPSVWCADNWRLYCQTRAISSSVGVVM